MLTEAQVHEQCDYVEEGGEPGWKCRKCGSWIQAKSQSCSVWIEGMTGGFGEVRHRTVCWCPQCHSEPSDRGIIQEPIGKALSRY